MADWDQPYGAEGWEVDQYGNLTPKTPGMNINTPPPTTTATPGSPGGPQLSTPQGGQLTTRTLSTPDSSSGRPRIQAPSASTLDPAPINPHTTPLSSTGAPSAGPPTLSPAAGIGSAALTGGTLLAAAPTTDQGVYDNANKTGSWIDNSALGKWLIDHGITSPSPHWGTAPATQTDSRLAPPPGPPPPVTAPPGPPPINLPPFNVPPPPPGRGQLPPFNRGPLPYPMPPPAAQGARIAPPGAAPTAAPQDPFAIHPSSAFTSIDRPNADIAGGRSVAGQLAPQYFNQAREPGGPAQMGALDLSGLFNHPAVAAAAAAHPAVQGALARQVATAQPQPQPRAPARAPVIQQQPAAARMAPGYSQATGSGGFMVDQPLGPPQKAPKISPRVLNANPYTSGVF